MHVHEQMRPLSRRVQDLPSAVCTADIGVPGHAVEFGVVSSCWPKLLLAVNVWLVHSIPAYCFGCQRVRPLQHWCITTLSCGRLHTVAYAAPACSSTLLRVQDSCGCYWSCKLHVVVGTQKTPLHAAETVVAEHNCTAAGSIGASL